MAKIALYDGMFNYASDSQARYFPVKATHGIFTVDTLPAVVEILKKSDDKIVDIVISLRGHENYHEVMDQLRSIDEWRTIATVDLINIAFDIDVNEKVTSVVKEFVVYENIFTVLAFMADFVYTAAKFRFGGTGALWRRSEALKQYFINSMSN